MTQMNYTVGSLVKARGREWVVLPESDEQVLILRPLGGSDQEVTGIYRGLEEVEPASFDPPDPQALGDYRSGRLLRDAVRLGFRSSAGPFRSFAHLGVEPRPYQFVPLLMALKLDPVRLLIADDVGIGKTVEASLIGRELLDRGEIERMAVLCPPHLSEQWQMELREKFHIDAVLVLASTATQLERTCRFGESIFERYPFVIVSIDFIKADRRRDEFLRTCPEFVIVDEAHTCTDTGEGRGGRQQRYDLVSRLAADPNRHLVLVTATPHSGNEASFRSLLRLLKPEFANLPEDLTGAEHEQERRKLAAHFVQRRRGDIQAYLHTDTPFPDRRESELHYTLSPEYRRLFERVLNYARETVNDPADGNKFRQRVRWWSALALLRSLASSPAAAAATLRNRAGSADTASEDEADRIGRHTVMDLLDNELGEGMDIVPGSDYEDQQAGESNLRRRLQSMARDAEAIRGAQDTKLQQATKMVESLLKDGFQPILFCRFIPTAEYVAQELRARLPKDVQIESVTGLLPPVERENRILQLDEHPKRVLVCTDCLSEGINLQEHFNAVIHYDLSWNPTRHEQREGRVDRYGQASKEVRVITYYGQDNPVDGTVLKVLIRKHQTIRTSLGISVPVPANSEQVLEAILESELLRGHKAPSSTQMTLPGLEDPLQQQFSLQWNADAEREKRSRTMFSHEGIKPDEVAAELAAMRSAMGSAIDVEHFTRNALGDYGASITKLHTGAVQVDYSGIRGLHVTQGAHEARGLKDAIQTVLHQEQRLQHFKARFELPVRDDELYLSRTHPLVESLAAYVMDAALDTTTGNESVAKRCGVMRTSQVEKRTTLLLVRMRYHIITAQRSRPESTVLAEDCQVLAFQGAPASAQWLDDKAWIEQLLEAQPDGNVYEDQARQFLRQLLAGIEHLQPHLEQVFQQRAQELADAHRRVRQATQIRGLQSRVEPQMPLDLLGVYLYLPNVAR